MKSKYRSRLSFSIAEFNNFTLDMRAAGIQLGMPAVETEDKKKMMEQFGLFGSSSDSNKFYPEIKSAKDIVPKPEDFVDVPFRLISATIVGGESWKASDFSDVRVLKPSTPKLKGKGVYKDHETDTDNWVGIVKETSWSDAFTNSTGESIPAGINGVLSIDAKTNPKVARGLLLGALYSNSVTVEFDWKPSHDFKDEDMFLRSIGTIGSDGQMVRRIVTLIHNYHETSLVWLGADPFSKLLDDKGNLINVDIASVYEQANQKEVEVYEKVKKIGVSFSIPKNVISLSKRNFENPTEVIEQIEKEVKTNKNDETMNEALIKLLRQKLSIADGVEITAEQLNKLGLVDPNAAVNTAKATMFDKLVGIEVVGLEGDPAKVTLTGEGAAVALPANFETEYQFVKKADVTALKTEAAKVAGLTANAVIGENFIKMKREEAIRMYRLNMGKDADAAVIKLMEEAGVDALEGLLKQYAKGAAVKFSGSCKKCGSEEFEFRSSFATPEKESESREDNKGVKVASFEEIHAKFDQRPFDISKKN